MFRNVYIGVDGTPTGRDAIALAALLAEPDAHITLAHVYSGDQSPRRFSRPALDAAAREDSQRLLEDELKATGVSADLASIASPSVGRGLHALAEEHACDLLVLGSCHRGPVGRVFMGDDTRWSLNAAPCAVAIAPLGFAAHPSGLSRIGVGYDFSDESRAALAVARELATRLGSQINALNVIPQAAWVYGAPMPADWGETLERDRRAAAERLQTVEGVHASAVYGVPGEELATFGDQVDLLLVGSRSYGPLQRLILGSTSSRLARHARCPLVVLPRLATHDAGADAEKVAVGATP